MVCIGATHVPSPRMTAGAKLRPTRAAPQTPAPGLTPQPLLCQPGIFVSTGKPFLVASMAAHSLFQLRHTPRLCVTSLD